MIENYEKYLDLLHEKRFSLLKQEMAEMFEADVAEFLEEVEDIDEVVKIFRLLPKNMGADTFSYLDSDLQEELIRKLSDSEIHVIIEDLATDDAADLLEEVPANVARRILAQSSPETRQTINKLLQYEDDTAGSVMTTECITLRGHLTVSEAFSSIRKQGKDAEHLNMFYVIDSRRVLLGTVSVKALIMAEPDTVVSDIMEDNVVYGETFTDQETIARLFSKYDLLTVPIVDKERRLVGIVTVDDVIDIISEEATEDISRMAGVVATDNKPYLKTGAGALWLARAPWLLLLMVSATFTGIILNEFESSLLPVLVACVPMLMGTGGNAGGQSSVTVIRGMSLQEIEANDILKVIWKELRVGFLCAASLAVVCFGKLMLVDNLLLGYDYTWQNSLVVALSIGLTVIMAKLVGAMLPFLAKVIKLDPAVVASPFITTIIDVLSLLIFVLLAGLIL